MNVKKEKDKVGKAAITILYKSIYMAEIWAQFISILRNGGPSL